MKKAGRNKQMIVSALAVSLVTASVTAVLMLYYFNMVRFRELGNICGEFIRKNPRNRQMILDILKKNYITAPSFEHENILDLLGYRPSDFWYMDQYIIILAGIGFAVGVFLFLFFWGYRQKKFALRIHALARYLENINRGGQGLILETSEDEFSGLQDEIYKTVTALYTERENAVLAKQNFADNLFNIAHQLKTPITAISLSAQMKTKQPVSESFQQIKQQTERLTYLQESLLLLSRVDAGTLVMKRRPVDVFTLLTLAADNLTELFLQAEVFVDISEMGEVEICADLEWSMEAVMNLLKNCMEHTPSGGTVHCSYEKNPLYVQIQIWDEGEGFAKEDLPHLFERFYRGKNEKNGGVGIGLSLAKAIVELQNGVIHAVNLPDGGGCFEIRFYS